MFDWLQLSYFLTDLQKIGDSWKGPEKIFIMGPTRHFQLYSFKSYQQNKVDCPKMGLKKKMLKRFGEQSHSNTCSSYTNPCHGECKPSLMLGEPILVIKIKFWHLFVTLELEIKLFYQLLRFFRPRQQISKSRISFKSKAYHLSPILGNDNNKEVVPNCLVQMLLDISWESIFSLGNL